MDGYKLCTTAHFEPISRKEAFLYKLGALLREFDAEIGDKGIISLEGVEITFGDDTPAVRYPHCTLNADNIMNYEKD